MNRPLLALTMGDPAGVGPESIVGAWAREAVHASSRLFVVGHPQVMERAAQLCGAALQVVRLPEQPDWKNLTSDLRTMFVLPACAASAAEVPPATVDPRGGQAAYDSLVAAARLALAGQIDGLVTAPLHKEALHLAGHHYPGHTELLAELCGVDEFAMMLYLPPCDAIQNRSGMAIVHVTLHMALRDVFAAMTEPEIVAKIRLVNQFMKSFQTEPVRIGVCALNPHGGEQGLFGDEEPRIIQPAVAQARQLGLSVQGPFPSDTLIARARDGEFDAVVAMYHDQGHIAIKLLAMHHAVNVTLGLPIIRTSVAHGTALDRAWQNRVETTGMEAAIQVAGQLARQRRA